MRALVIPAFNEAVSWPRLSPLIDRDLGHRIVEVNDGSADDTSVAAGKAGFEVVDRSSLRRRHPRSGDTVVDP